MCIITISASDASQLTKEAQVHPTRVCWLFDTSLGLGTFEYDAIVAEDWVTGRSASDGSDDQRQQ